jgi:3',5'-cyclic-AMP phosphodiesterase
MRIAQLTDTHLTTPESDAEHAPGRTDDLARAVEAVNALDVDIVIHTGDMTQTAIDAEYSLAREILTGLDAPLYVVPGNRDSRAGLRRAFGPDGYMGGQGVDPVMYVINDHAVRLIGFDTQSSSSMLANLCAERLGWLDAALADCAGEPVAVMMHHPPIWVKASTVKPFNFETQDDADALEGVIAKHDVARVFCGHSHRAYLDDFGGADCSTVPSVATDLRQGEYPDIMSASVVFQVHEYGADGRFQSQSHVTEAAAGDRVAAA